MSALKNFASKTLEALYRVAAWQPLVVLALILAAQTVLLFESRQLWFSDEVRYANVFQQMVHGGNWLLLKLNGMPYPDKPPVYFWLLEGVRLIVKHMRPSLFFMGAAVSSLAFLASTLYLARRVARADKTLRLAAGAMLLTCFYYIGLSHYSRMDLLFAALIVASQVCLYEALVRDARTLYAPMGFLLMAVAALTKGPLGLALPLLPAFLFALWAGRLRRFWRRDMAVGLGVMLLLLLGWVTGVSLVDDPTAWPHGGGYLQNIFQQQMVKRATDTWHHGQPFWHYAATLPAAFLPWSLLLICLPLGRLFKPAFWRGLVAGRKNPERHGQTFLWFCFVGGFALLSAISIKIVVYLLPLFAPLAVLSAQALAGLTPARERRFWLAVAILLGLLALAMPFVNFVHPWPIEIKGLYVNAALMLVLALGLWALSNAERWRGALMYLVLALTLWLQPAGLLTAPSLDPAMSPKAQGEVMGEYIAQGYAADAHKVYNGIYAYYASRAAERFVREGTPGAAETTGAEAASSTAIGATPSAAASVAAGAATGAEARADAGQAAAKSLAGSAAITTASLNEGKVYLETHEWEDLDAFLAAHPKAVVVMPAKYWDPWTDRQGLEEVQRQWVSDRPYVLGARKVAPASFTPSAVLFAEPKPEALSAPELKPEPGTASEATPEPEISSEATPEATSEPEAVNEPKPEATLEAETLSAPKPEVKPEPGIAPEATPEETSEPEAKPEPRAAVTSEAATPAPEAPEAVELASSPAELPQEIAEQPTTVEESTTVEPSGEAREAQQPASVEAVPVEGGEAVVETGETVETAPTGEKTEAVSLESEGHAATGEEGHVEATQ